jgi:hypothetical protein
MRDRLAIEANGDANVKILVGASLLIYVNTLAYIKTLEEDGSP